MQFTLSITLGNDAMQDAVDLERALDKVRAQVADLDGGWITTADGGTVHDMNGNRVGDWSVS
ncbi:hypothetical protein GCM10022234_00310 [Aeromicrobium panaciterrae]|uniref:hypothetical protein n=1 Tax=Aeromicrobium panaciterrae TaxID=363861 RepID=UPI0031D4D9BA